MPPSVQVILSSYTHLLGASIPRSIAIPLEYGLSKLAGNPDPVFPSFNNITLSAKVVIVDSTVVVSPLISKSPVITTRPAPSSAPFVVSSVIFTPLPTITF